MNKTAVVKALPLSKYGLFTDCTDEKKSRLKRKDLYLKQNKVVRLGFLSKLNNINIFRGHPEMTSSKKSQF